MTAEAVALSLLQEDASSGSDRFCTEGFHLSCGSGIGFGSPPAYGTDRLGPQPVTGSHSGDRFLFTSRKHGVETRVQSLCAGSATGAGDFLRAGLVLHEAWGPEPPSSDSISLVPVTRLLPTLD